MFAREGDKLGKVVSYWSVLMDRCHVNSSGQQMAVHVVLTMVKIVAVVVLAMVDMAVVVEIRN